MQKEITETEKVKKFLSIRGSRAQCIIEGCIGACLSSFVTVCEHHSMQRLPVSQGQCKCCDSRTMSYGKSLCPSCYGAVSRAIGAQRKRHASVKSRMVLKRRRKKNPRKLRHHDFK